MSKTWIIVVLILALFFISGAFACSVSIDNEIVELRAGSGDYSDNIVAADGDDIDIRITFDIDSISGSSCASNITAKAQVYRKSSTSSSWSLYKTVSSQSSDLEEDSFTFPWPNEFEVSDSYAEYKVVGTILEGSNNLKEMEAFIDVENADCSDINPIAYDVTMDESSQTTRTFKIENNTNVNFEVTDVYFTFSKTTVDDGSIDYDDYIYDGEDGTVEVTLNSASVSSQQSVTGYFYVTGKLGNKTCSSSSIGKDTFYITVENNGGSSNTGTSSDCDELSIHGFDFDVAEGTTNQKVFYIQNNSTKRFELLDVSVSSSGLTLRNAYYEQYAFPGELADIVIETIAPNVTANNVYGNYIKVKGKFSDGKTCSFDNIERKNFDVTVLNNSQGGTAINSCSIAIDTPSVVDITNYGKIPFSVTNNSSNTLIIYVESALNVSPTIISLPSNSSISREINVSLNEEYGEVRLRAESEGCSVPVRTVSIHNIAIGNFESVTLTTRIERDENRVILVVEAQNPTDKVFVGTLSFDLDGQIVNDREFTIMPGKNIAEFELDASKPINGTIQFASNGKTIEKAVNEGQAFGSLAGLFLFGDVALGIGIILLIIIIAVIIVAAVMHSSNKEKKEVFERQ